MTVRRWIVLVGLLLTATAIYTRTDAQGYVMTASVYQTVNVRSGPDTRYEIVAQIAAGDTVFVTGRDGEANHWYYVELENGQTGWIPSYLLIMETEPVPLPIIASATSGDSAAGDPVRIIAYGQVNVRNGPGITNDIIAQLDVGDEALAVARGNAGSDWLYVESETLRGWVAYFTVYVQGDPGTLPIRVPDATGQGLVAPMALLRTRFNIRLHIDPDLNSPVVGEIPFNSAVLPIAKSNDGHWLYVAYLTYEGWAVSELFVVTPEQIDALPLFMVSDETDTAASELMLSGGDTLDFLFTEQPEATPEATPEMIPEVTDSP